MRRAALLVVGAILAGCNEDPAGPAPPEDPPLGSLPASPRVLVVNTLSETLSALDLDAATMTVQAALTGAWTNRASASPDRRLLLLTDSGDNEVRVLDAGTLQLLARIDVGDGRNPFLARALGDGRALVSNWLAAEVQLLDLGSARVEAAVATTPGPEGFAVVGMRAFVACSHYLGDAGTYGEGRVDVVDLANGRVEASIAVGPNPQEVLVGPDGRLHVICTGDYGGRSAGGRIDVLDAVSFARVGAVEIGGSPARAALGPDGAMWVVGHAGGLRRYDAVSLAIHDDALDPALPTAGLSAIAFDEGTGRAYVTAFPDDLLLAIDAASGMLVDAWIVGDGPVDVLVQRP